MRPPRFLVIAMALAFVQGGATSVNAGTGWIPPRSVTAILPSASFAPGSSHTLDLTVRANGASANLLWSATASGQFIPGVTPLGGSLSVPAESTMQVTLTITVPPAALGAGAVSVTLTHEFGGGQAAKVSGTVFAASGGRPEVWPLPSTWGAQAGTAGSVSFQVHSLVGSTEQVTLTTGRFNPDPNNLGALFPGSAAPSSVALPGGSTITVSAPTTIAASAYAGNWNAVQLSVSSTAGITSSSGPALATASNPDSLPTALYPVGLTPTSEAAAGRDGPVELPGLGLWLIPSGLDGIRVMEAGSSLERIGAVDADANGVDDRLVGRVRIPSFAASLVLVPGFVGPAGDTLDLGLLAAGRAGLMLLDLRTVVDPPFGAWEDFFDRDGNGIDDRILRTIPLSGFATDVAWFRAASGRVVALVADADTGSVPVAASYDPAMVAAGTGAGVVAIDVTAAFDSLGSVPYAAGMLATPGSAMDLELRGGSSPDLGIADGDGGVSVYHLMAASGAPASVTFTPLGSVALSSAWGTPYARDVSWVSNTSDSEYVAVAASAGGVQIVRAPPGGAPSLVLVQQTAAAAIGLAGTWTGNMAVALGSGGVALMRSAGAAELDQIAPASPAPYTAPVLLSRGQVWTEGRALEVASHATPSASATSLRFLGTTGPIPDVLVSDGARALLLRPGQATIVAVEDLPTPPRAVPLAIAVIPNPAGDRAEVRGFDASARLGGGSARIEIFDVQGKLVRSVATRPGAAGSASGNSVRFTWDGRDDRGRRVGSGRYWVRVRQGERAATRAFLMLR